MASSVGTAWIQIKPSLAGISSDIKKELNSAGSGASSNFGNQFKSSFLLSAKASFSEAFSEFGRRSDAAFSQFKTAAAVGFTAALAGGTALLKNFIDSASALQSLRASFESLTGSAAGAKRVMDSLYEFGKKTAFTNEQINQTARLFLGAGVNADKLLGIMNQVGDLAGATGADLQGLALPISQALAAGKLQTQDWYQILNQGGGVFKKYIIAALGAGHSTKTFAQDLSDGAINAEVLQKALALANSEGNAAFNGAIKQSQTFNGRLSNMQEAITNVGLSILGVDAKTGDVDPSGIFSKLSDSVSQATDWLSKNKEEIKQWIDQVISTGKSIAKWIGDNRELVKIILEAVVAYKALQIGVGAYRSAMDTLMPFYKLAKGGVELMIGGIQTLTGRFKDLGEASGGAKSASDSINGMSDAVNKAPKSFTFSDSITSFFKNIGQTLSGAVNAVMQPIKALLGGIGEAIGAFFKALANPQLLIGVLVFAAASAGIALAILLIGGAIGTVSPGLSTFMNDVLIPFGKFLVDSLVTALFAVTVAMIALTNTAVIPLVSAVSGGLVQAFNAIGGVITSAGNAVSGVVDSIANGIAKVINSISNLIGSVGRQDWYGTGYGITRNFSAGLVDGLIDLLQDSINKIINSMLNVPGIGQALKAIGLKSNPVNLAGFKLGRRAMGGSVWGPGSGTSDSIPMAISNGEYVIREASARKVGYGNLDKLNATGELGDGGDTYNIYPPSEFAGDYKILAQWVSKYIALQKARVM